MHKDFDGFLKLLNHHKVRYVIVGGYALSAHLLPRATKDLDILIEASENNAMKVVEALREFGFCSSNLETGREQDLLDVKKLKKLNNTIERR